MSDKVLDLRDLAADWQIAFEEGEDVKPYVALCDELGIEGSPEALRDYGEGYEPTLIREDYFTEYAQELAADIQPFADGSPEAELLSSWPYRCIDWEQAALELENDYTSVSFDGDTYYIRA